MYGKQDSSTRMRQGKPLQAGLSRSPNVTHDMTHGFTQPSHRSPVYPGRHAQYGNEVVPLWKRHGDGGKHLDWPPQAERGARGSGFGD